MAQIVPYHMTHNAEPEAVDLLLEVRMDKAPCAMNVPIDVQEAREYIHVCPGAWHVCMPELAEVHAQMKHAGKWWVAIASTAYRTTYMDPVPCLCHGVFAHIMC